MAVLLIGEIEPLNVWIAELQKRMLDIDLRVWPELEKPEDIETVVVGIHPPGTLNKFPNLKLIISLGAGVDHIGREKNLPNEIPIIRLVDPGLTSQASCVTLPETIA